MNDFPLVSVIILSYKQMQYIFGAIDSVMSQGYPNIELIIADDGTDEFEIDDVQDYVAHNNSGNITNAIVIKNEVNVGTVKNLNGALNAAGGEYIMFFAGDDLHTTDSISKSVAFMESNNRDFFMAAGHTIPFNDGDDVNSVEIAKDPKIHEMFAMEPKDRYVHMCKKGVLIASIAAHIFRREFFIKEGLFDERYRLYEDRPMLLRIARQGYRVGYLDFSILFYRTNVGVSTGGSIHLAYDIKMLAEYEYWPNVDLLGKRFCRRYQKMNDCVYELRANYSQWSLPQKILFGIKKFDVIAFRILPTWGILSLIRRLRKYSTK